MAEEDEIPKPLYLYDLDPQDPNTLELKPSDFQPSPEMASYLNWESTKTQIGEIVIEFQFIETIIKRTIAALLDETQFLTGYVMTADMNIERMLSVLFALFCNKFPNHPNTEEFREILVECNECRKRRNFIVHAYWFPTRDGNGLCFKYPRTQFGKPYASASTQTVTTETLRADATKCTEAWRRLGEFTQKYIPAALPPPDEDELGSR